MSDIVKAESGGIINLETVESICSELKDAFFETCQPRSTLQIERFVVGDHETKERQYKQCIDELVRKIMTLRRVSLEKKEIKLKIEKIESKLINLHHPADSYKIEKLSIKKAKMYIDLDELNIAIEGSLRELNVLYRIYNSFEHKYTADEIQEADAKYWYLRLAKLAESQMESSPVGKPEAGTIDALRKLGVRRDLGLRTVLDFAKQGRIEPSVLEELEEDKILKRIPDVVVNKTIEQQTKGTQ